MEDRGERQDLEAIEGYSKNILQAQQRSFTYSFRVIVRMSTKSMFFKKSHPKSYPGGGESHKLLQLAKELLALVRVLERKCQFTLRILTQISYL